VASPSVVSSEVVQTAQDSYDRCRQAHDFFPKFYNRLLASNESIPPMFVNTSFEKQNKLLDHGIGSLLIFAKRRNPALLQRIAERHGRRDLAVKPSLYGCFLDSLIAAVAEFDPQFSPDVERAWRAAMTPGIEFMKAAF